MLKKEYRIFIWDRRKETYLTLPCCCSSLDLCYDVIVDHKNTDSVSHPEYDYSRVRIQVSEVSVTSFDLFFDDDEL